MAPLLEDSLGIPGPLGLVVDPDVFLRRAGTQSAVLLKEAVHILNEYSTSECILQHVYQRPVA